MLPFAGSKAIGVNPNSKSMKAATALAAWLGSAEMQALHAELRNGGVQPIAKSVVEGNVDADAAAAAQIDTFNNKSVYQPTIAEMGAYWTNAGSMGQALANGEINADNVKDMQAKWNAGINNSGL
jgi:arabinogalactan oligomer/maltooligosaccharide transport system substrate-binding protein